MNDEVAILVGNVRLMGWQAVQISRSAEAIPNGFALFATETYPGDAGRIIIMPGDPVEVYIGEDLVITGYVDRYSVTGSANSHIVQIIGRGKCQDLVDCSADIIGTPELKGGMVNVANLHALAAILASPFGISVRQATASSGAPVPGFQIALGETPYEVIAKVAQYYGFLVYEDETGALVLDRVGSQVHASGFAQGVNIESYACSFSYDQRFSSYTVVLNSIAQATEINELINLRARVDDPTITRYRPRIIVSAQTQTSTSTDPTAVALACANWELARRIGRSQEIVLTCDSWRDSAGLLWQPNRFVPIDAPAMKIVGQKWVIGSVTYRKDQSGTHADLSLMPPGAFDPQPTSLTPYNWEIQRALPTASPLPPSPGAPQ